MRLDRDRCCDVLVIGSGIAGITAALEGAAAGCSVTLVCRGGLFSGSSFYPGTWGLGLIGPADEEDADDLADTITQVGCHMSDPALVRTFVRGIQPAIEKVRAMGVRFRRAGNGGEKEYIPCFDHKHRDWNGIEFDSAREVFSRKLKEGNVTIIPHCGALELVMAHGRVCGVVAAGAGRLHYFGGRSVVLATGGYGSLFQYHLCTEDVEGVGQSLALNAGCELVNMEFMQMMPGYISPAYQTIFNERTFRFARMTRSDGAPLLDRAAEAALDIRATHGPFTCRLPSKVVDLALFDAFCRDPKGVTTTYSEEMRRHPPEFMTAYFEWLKQAHGLTMEDPIRIGIFAHAANGGIRIDSSGYTGVEGLFAAGEATGGMHGADRIGGLSTANGLVFGGIAGRSAAAGCVNAPQPPDHYDFHAMAVGGAADAFRRLRSSMSRHAMIERSERGLGEALALVEELRGGAKPVPSDDPAAVAETCRLYGRLQTAESILRAALLRRESRGSHYRSDYPEQDPGQTAQIIVRRDAVGIRADFAKEKSI